MVGVAIMERKCPRSCWKQPRGPQGEPSATQITNPAHPRSVWKGMQSVEVWHIVRKLFQDGMSQWPEAEGRPARLSTATHGRAVGRDTSSGPQHQTTASIRFFLAPKPSACKQAASPHTLSAMRRCNPGVESFYRGRWRRPPAPKDVMHFPEPLALLYTRETVLVERFSLAARPVDAAPRVGKVNSTLVPADAPVILLVLITATPILCTHHHP